MIWALHGSCHKPTLLCQYGISYHGQNLVISVSILSKAGILKALKYTVYPTVQQPTLHQH